ncbi:MAG: hypothetical protein MUP55_02670 [Candidatus Aenigmarchaeota archaeon]|nr:hypothetical protein [Candidatus Aenigmarchaeota archaeon]
MGLLDRFKKKQGGMFDGSFTGDGQAQQPVAIPFRPKYMTFVQVVMFDPNTKRRILAIKMASMDGWNTIRTECTSWMAENPAYLYYDSGYAIQITDTGFIASGVANERGVASLFVAWG